MTETTRTIVITTITLKSYKLETNKSLILNK